MCLILNTSAIKIFSSVGVVKVGDCTLISCGSRSMAIWRKMSYCTLVAWDRLIHTSLMSFELDTWERCRRWMRFLQNNSWGPLRSLLEQIRDFYYRYFWVSTTTWKMLVVMMDTLARKREGLIPEMFQMITLWQ